MKGAPSHPPASNLLQAPNIPAMLKILHIAKWCCFQPVFPGKMRKRTLCYTTPKTIGWSSGNQTWQWKILELNVGFVCWANHRTQWIVHCYLWLPSAPPPAPVAFRRGCLVRGDKKQPDCSSFSMFLWSWLTFNSKSMALAWHRGFQKYLHRPLKFSPSFCYSKWEICPASPVLSNFFQVSWADDCDNVQFPMTHRIHVWYIYEHWGYIYGKCYHIYIYPITIY